jgi:tRNA A37 threonylcarbamoyladenosine dehydratase
MLEGVGSHAAHLLLRSGVGKLRLIDFDQVSLSSLNRHALATRADVGMPKATCLKVGFVWQCIEHPAGVGRLLSRT